MVKTRRSGSMVLFNTLQIIFGLGFYALLLGAAFVGQDNLFYLSATGAAVYVFCSSFWLSRYGMKQGFYSAFFLAVPTFLFSVFALMDWVTLGNPAPFLFWFVVGASIVIVGIAGILTSKQLGFSGDKQ